MTRNQIIGAVVVVVVVGAGAFWGGMSYAKGQTTTSTRGSGAGSTFTRGAGGGFAGAGGAAGGGFTAGQIISAGNGQIVIQMANASSTEIVLVGSSTQILNTVEGSMSNLTPGTSVVVTGSSNSDGSLTAQSIEIRPAGMNFGGFGTGRTGAATQSQ